MGILLVYIIAWRTAPSGGCGTAWPSDPFSFKLLLYCLQIGTGILIVGLDLPINPDCRKMPTFLSRFRFVGFLPAVPFQNL